MGINISSNNYSDLANIASIDSTQTKINQFISGLSCAVEKTDKKNSNTPISITSIQTGPNSMGGAAAKYATESTETDPIIQVIVTGASETERYNVHVKDVNPSSASQLEMFALSAYTDDKGITEPGTFGTYSRLNVYQLNAADNGMSPQLNSSQDFYKKIDWLTVVKKMANCYLQNAATYKQYLDADKLSNIFSSLN